jgi:hypothetical protein
MTGCCDLNVTRRCFGDAGEEVVNTPRTVTSFIAETMFSPLGLAQATPSSFLREGNTDVEVDHSVHLRGLLSSPLSKSRWMLVRV